MILSNRFDITKPILENLFHEAQSNGGKLSDSTFTQCCNEYDADENDTMDRMMRCEEYEFKRYSTGWIVEKI